MPRWINYPGWPVPLPASPAWMDACWICELNGSAKLFIKFHCELAPDEGFMTFACDAASAFRLEKRFGRVNRSMRLSTLRRWCDGLGIEPIESRWSS